MEKLRGFSFAEFVEKIKINIIIEGVRREIWIVENEWEKMKMEWFSRVLQ